MAKNRQKAQELCLEYIDRIMPGGENRQIYEQLFESMDDDQFEQFIDKLRDGRQTLSVFAPNFGKSKMDVKRNFQIAKDLGHSFFQQVWVPAKNGDRAYLTPVPYLVVYLPIRRQAQLLTKKISIPEDNASVDMYTGQPTGKSKGSKISYPEVQVLAAMGLDKSLVELLKYRGGDERGFDAYNAVIDRTGGVSQAQIEPFASGVKATETLKYFLLGMGLRPTGL